MDIHACNQCHAKKPIKNLSQCSRCMSSVYCDQTCQKLHWPIHKLQCKSSNVVIKDNFVRHAHKQIEGNIMILASHKENKSGHVLVNIDESIEEFTDTKSISIHCAYISYIPDVVLVSDKMQSINVLYKFTNYSMRLVIPIVDMEKFIALKNNHPLPKDNWPVFFDF